MIGAALRLNGYGKLLAIEPDAYSHNMARINVEKAGLSDRVEIIPNSSHDELCKARLVAEGPFELAFIDASHDYDAALHDIELCASLLHDNGFMVLHDTGTAGPGMDTTGKGGVRQALYDFAERHLDMKTIYYEYPLWPNPCGAGIVCKQRYHPAMAR